MEMQQIMELLLARMNTNMKYNQEDVLARLETKVETNRENLLATLEAKFESNRETYREERKSERKAYQLDLKKMMKEMLRDKQDEMDTWLAEKQDGRKQTTACQEATKIEPDTGMMESVGEQQVVPKEEAAVIPVGALRKRRTNRNLAVGRHQKLKGRIQASCEPQKRLTVAGRKMTRRARVSWCKRNIARKDLPGPMSYKKSGERTFGRRCQPEPECSNGIRSRGVEKVLRLRKGRKTANSIRGWKRRHQS
jgi:hypothetical protein